MAGVGEAQRRAGRPLPPSARGLPGPPPLPKVNPRFDPVDREKTCPLLLRVFTKIGGHHTVGDFAVRGKEPKDEVQIYTWMDATLRELTDLVKEVAPEARRRDALLSFAFVYPDKHGRFVVREFFANQRKVKTLVTIFHQKIIRLEKPILIQTGDDQTMEARHWVNLAFRLVTTWM